MNDNNEIITADAPSDPFASHVVAPEGVRHAGSGEHEDHQAELAAWLRTQEWSDFAQSLADWYDEKGSLTQKQFAAGEKMRKKCEARKPRNENEPRIESDGIYRDGDIIAKVQWNQTGTRLYAKRLDLQTGKFNYEPGLVNELRPAMKMTLEEAKQFGHLYGVCCVCGATLTNEDSIRAGIGPICASKGWW